MCKHAFLAIRFLVALSVLLVLIGGCAARPPGSAQEVRAPEGEKEVSIAALDKGTSLEDTNLQRRDCYERTLDFSNGGTPGWDLQTTDSRQNWINGEWALHSNGNGANGWSRIRYKEFTFNTYGKAWTQIKVKVRGAPDAGKNSNAYLIQTNGHYDVGAAVQDGSKDEVDFFEYYGGQNCNGRNDATINVFRRGNSILGGLSYHLSDAGHQAYTYEMILNNGARTLNFYVWTEGGQKAGEYHMSGDNVPSNPMELFIGIWDCRGKGWCPGEFNGDSYMGVRSVYMKAC